MVRLAYRTTGLRGFAIACFSAALAVASGRGEAAYAEDSELVAFRSQVVSLLKSFEASPELEGVSTAVASSATFREVDVAAQPLTLAAVGINPEARVKIASAPDRVDLVAGQPRRFLVRIENLAGVTAPLRLRGLDLAASDAGEAKWLRLRFVEPDSDVAPLATAALQGSTDEYLAVEVFVAEPGVREMRLVADAGQGTQDLGFRATADVQVRTRTSSDAVP